MELLLAKDSQVPMRRIRHDTSMMCRPTLGGTVAGLTDEEKEVVEQIKQQREGFKTNAIAERFESLYEEEKALGKKISRRNHAGCACFVRYCRAMTPENLPDPELARIIIKIIQQRNSFVLKGETLNSRLTYIYQGIVSGTLAIASEDAAILERAKHLMLLSALGKEGTSILSVIRTAQRRINLADKLREMLAIEGMIQRKLDRKIAHEAPYCETYMKAKNNKFHVPEELEVLKKIDRQRRMFRVSNKLDRLREIYRLEYNSQRISRNDSQEYRFVAYCKSRIPTGTLTDDEHQMLERILKQREEFRGV